MNQHSETTGTGSPRLLAISLFGRRMNFAPTHRWMMSNAMADLRIPLKGVYFDQIKAGTKHEEYRLTTDYWRKRLVGRRYDRIILTRGYPKASDASRHMVLPWRGFAVKIISHPHFGAEPVDVYAINVSQTQEQSDG